MSNWPHVNDPHPRQRRYNPELDAPYEPPPAPRRRPKRWHVSAFVLGAMVIALLAAGMGVFG